MKFMTLKTPQASANCSQPMTPSLTKSGTPRKRKPGAGRPALGKIKLTVHILPSTRAALGAKPGKKLDEICSRKK